MQDYNGTWDNGHFTGTRTVKERDKYGRPCLHATRWEAGRQIGRPVVIVSMPKTVWQGTSYSEARPNERYLVNDWNTQYIAGQSDEANGIRYTRTRAQAIALAAGIVGSLVAA